jgi:protease IV
VQQLKTFLKKILGNFFKILLYGTAILLLVYLSGFLFKKPAQKVNGFEYASGDQASKDLILQIPIHGLILGSSSIFDAGFLARGSMLTFGYDVKEVLKEAANNSAVKGVLLHIISPGGTIYGSQAIAEGVEIFRSSGKPIFAFVEGLAASGGVWSFAPAERIIADEGSMLGSVGVIGGEFYYYDEPFAYSQGIFGGSVTTKRGISQTIIHAGKGKDLGSPFRRLTESEKELLQKAVNQGYDKFLKHLKKHRAINEEMYRNKIGAAILSAEQALEYGMIDKIESYDNTIDNLAERAGLTDSFKVVTPFQETPTVLKQLLGILSPTRAISPSCSLFFMQALVFSGSKSQFCSLL